MEITTSNFSEQIPNIIKDLKNASFVAFDAEFTALLSAECFKHRLFDTNEERYNKIKNEVSKMIMTQVGLTMFQYERETDKYVGTGYTFHLCPQDFADVDQSFIFQASTLKFLCKHNFNFNKFTYEGLPYLSKAEEASIREHLKNNTLLQSITSGFTIEEERELQNHYSTVSKWLTSRIDTQVYEDRYFLDVQDPVMKYVAHHELRSRFPAILTTNSLGNSNKILIFKNKNVEGAINISIEELENNLMDYVLGFSRIISLLEQYQKPIIGHNIFLDTILLHNQFIGPLPKDYRKFKRNIHEMFPRVYDTKYISHEMGRKLTMNEMWKSNALQDLYEFFKEGKCAKLQEGVNLIGLSKPFNVKQTYHEAGWDSYCSGYCFIRLGHWAACENSGKKKNVGPSELLAGLAPYCNQVNVIRAATLYMNLEEEDPPRQRPDWLHILALQEPVINVAKVATILSSYGSIDVKPFETRSALIAASSKITVERILRGFKADKEYRITHYNPYRYSTAKRVAIWGGAVITGSLMLFLINKKIKSIS